MKYTAAVATAGLLIALITSPVNAENKIGPDAKGLWKFISQTSPYTEWDFWPDHQGLQEGEAPHAPQHKIFVNEIGLSAPQPPMKDGSIVVKENIGNDNKLKALTVMYKIAGYNPKGGDWFWAKFSSRGTVSDSGKIRGCINCHDSVEDNDYIFVHDFK